MYYSHTRSGSGFLLIAAAHYFFSHDHKFPLSFAHMYCKHFASLMRSSLIVQAIEAAALHADHDMSVVVQNMRVLTGCASCDVICFVDRLTP